MPNQVIDKKTNRKITCGDAIAFALSATIAVSAGAIVAAQSSVSQNATAPTNATSQPALTVTATVVGNGSIANQFGATGNIAAWQEVSIGTESNGLRIEDIFVDVGDTVKSGQVLARFASDVVQANLRQAQAALVEAEANASAATTIADRARGLQTSDVISKQQISQYLSAETTAKARVSAATAALEVQQWQMKHTQLVAPDDGVISARIAMVGAVVGGGAELFRLIRQGRLTWRAEVSSADLGKLSIGMMATIVAPNGESVQGKVRMIAPTVDVSTRAGLVFVDVIAPRQLATMTALKPGMFARGDFNLGSAQAMTVPQQAVVIRDGFSYLFRINPDQRISQVKIQTGRRPVLNGVQHIEILTGINPGTRVVASGVGFLNDGDLVKVAAAGERPPTPAAAPAAPATDKRRQ